MCRSVGYSHGDGLLLNVEKLYSGTVTKDETLEAMNMADVTYIATASYCRPKVHLLYYIGDLDCQWGPTRSPSSSRILASRIVASRQLGAHVDHGRCISSKVLL